MKNRILATLVSLTTALSFALTGCGGSQQPTADASSNGASKGASSASDTGNGNATALTESTLPFSKEPIEIRIARMSYPGIRPSANDVWIWKDFSEKSNITINWEEYPVTTWQESINLKLSTGDLPDAFYQIPITANQIVEHSSNGNFIALNDLIAQNAPNITKMYEENPSFKKPVIMPDGKMYSLPYIQNSHNDSTVRWYLHQPTLDALSMETPTTLEGFDAYLRAAKEKFPDSVPLCMPDEGSAMYQAMLGAYGLGTTGIQGVSTWIDLDKDGKLRFINTDPLYKEMLGQFATWYRDGLMHPEQFSKIEIAKWQNLGSEGKVGAFAWVNTAYIGNEAGMQYTGVSQFQGPHGDQIMSWADAQARGNFAFLITKNNRYPAETMRWADYWYGEEGYLYGAIGIEGETYQKSGDSYTWSPDIQAKVDELGRQVGPYQFLETWYGGWEPQWYGRPVSEENNQKLYDLKYFTPAEENFHIAEEDCLSYLPKEIWSPFVPTNEEATELTTITADMTTYLQEMQAKFITGAANLDTDWDQYVKTLEKMGLAKYMEIKQQQYDRYQSAD